MHPVTDKSLPTPPPPNPIEETWVDSGELEDFGSDQVSIGTAIQDPNPNITARRNLRIDKPNENGYENLHDLQRRQTSITQTVILRQSIAMRGTLVDVYVGQNSGEANKVYGVHSGQQLEVRPVGRGLVLGLGSSDFRVTKDDIVSGYFNGNVCYAEPELSLSNDDVLVEVSTQAKWIVTGMSILGTEGRTVLQFRVSSMME